MFGHFSWMIRTWLNDLLILFFDNLKTVGFRDLFKLPIWPFLTKCDIHKKRSKVQVYFNVFCVTFLTIQFSASLGSVKMIFHHVVSHWSRLPWRSPARLRMIIINRGDNPAFFSDKVIHFDPKPVGSSDLNTKKKCYKSY